MKVLGLKIALEREPRPVKREFVPILVELRAHAASIAELQEDLRVARRDWEATRKKVYRERKDVPDGVELAGNGERQQWMTGLPFKE